MAPTPTEGDPPPSPSPSSPPMQKYWNTTSIIGIAIFAFLVVLFALLLTLYLLHRRKEQKKLPASHRNSKYRPFKTESNTAKSALLDNVEPAPETEDRKSAMFTRDRSRSSVSLYVDQEHHDRRVSTERVSLIPLQITPVEEVYDPLSNVNVKKASISDGSGVSRGSRGSSSRYSTTTGGGSWTPSSTTGGSLGMSNIPIPEGTGDLSVTIPKTRPRSTSSASARYYEVNQVDNADLTPVGRSGLPKGAPPVPTIVHTPVE